MSNKKYGLGYERKRKKMLEEQGYTCMRARGSFGLFDIIAATKSHWILESIKATKLPYYSAKHEISRLDNFTNAPVGTTIRLVLFQEGKMKILYERVL